MSPSWEQQHLAAVLLNFQKMPAGCTYKVAWWAACCGGPKGCLFVFLVNTEKCPECI